MNNCHQFKALSSREKLELVQRHNYCVRCLDPHLVSACPKNWSCYQCQQPHHTALHDALCSPNLSLSSCTTSNVVLATAEIKVFGTDGSPFTFRCLIDQGSMSSYISERAVKLLNLKRKTNSTRVMGIGGQERQVRGEVTVSFTSARTPKNKKKRFSITPLILNKVTSNLPTVSGEAHPEYDNWELADTSYFTSSRIDFILGADIFSELIMTGVRKGPLLAQRTHLGWILSGCPQTPTTIATPHCYTAICSNEELNETLSKFWMTEEKVMPISPWSAEENMCETFYSDTTWRNEQGRFVCRLPLKEDTQLGRSRHVAVGNMLQLEKRFRGNPPLKERYVKCMEEYIELGHAVAALNSEKDLVGYDSADYQCYYIPHLAVIKESSSTTKTRVVFNASSKTSNNKSLNDNLLVGPVLQRDVIEKILRFRMGKYVFVCDISKMYRQIMVNQADWDYQRIIWRPTEFEELKEYWLTTVTFGESSAPFTAIRTLTQLAKDSQMTHPIASACLLHNTYVDDMHYGADSIVNVITGRDELINCLQSAGMSLRKWASNDPSILADLPKDHWEDKHVVKFMGLNWCPSTDMLFYEEVDLQCQEWMTRRELLSQIARVTDPPGWIQPLIVPAKLLMQATWCETKEWDVRLPKEFSTKWEDIHKSLSKIPAIKIPRWTMATTNGSVYELHGFADASSAAYGCVIYLRTTTDGLTLPPCIILAKSRVAAVVAPSIPRLELKGALLLSAMMAKVIQALDIPMTVYAWLDSKVALCWINDPAPEKWNVFVRNRVVATRCAVADATWQYVNTKENPADIISRGCDFETLMDSKLWFNGPEWLRSWNENHMGTILMSEEDQRCVALEKLKSTVSNVSIRQVAEEDVVHKLISSYSNYRKLQRVTAYVMRFINAIAKKPIPKDVALTVQEIQSAEMVLIKYVQACAYEEELLLIPTKANLPTNSKLCGLNPFIDSEGIVRVGGRLNKAHVPFSQKHPSILPADHPFTDLIVSNFHEMVLHGGVQTTLNQIRTQFWIINGIQVVKKWMKNCVKCQRSRTHINNQLMGILPSPRVNLTKAFLNSAVDFAGPFKIRSRAGRGIRATKGYVAVFVCMATKAIHLEVVGSLTTHDFMAALRRFVARRGQVTTMHSDNGTNFVGAARLMKELSAFLCTRGIEWSFIPAQAPHFGGLWEAGVKSVKTHLGRVAGGLSFTYEEFSTILCQIEGCLNSRPLCPLTNNIDDLDVLTPQHFLTGMSYTPIIEENAEITGSLRRWQLCQAIYQEVCRRYTREYLHRLQARPKWLRTSDNLAVGQLVLLIEDNQPIASWPLGRVTKVHPGPDGLVRVATVRTKTGELSRPTRKLSLLPVVHRDDDPNVPPST